MFHGMFSLYNDFSEIQTYFAENTQLEFIKLFNEIVKAERCDDRQPT